MHIVQIFRNLLTMADWARRTCSRRNTSWKVSSLKLSSGHFMEMIPGFGQIPTQTTVHSLHIRSYDCFTEPISDCGLPNAPPRDPSLVKELDRIRASMPENPLRDILTKLMDVCTFAKVLRKPVKWVHGHLLMYLTRPRPDAKAAIHHRKREIFSKLPRVVGTRTAVTVGMQVR